MGFFHFKIIGREYDWEPLFDNWIKPNIENYWIYQMIRETRQN